MSAEPFISDYSPPRWMPTHFSRKNDGKEKGKENELVIFTKFADNLAADATVLLAIRSKTSKSVFKD